MDERGDGRVKSVIAVAALLAVLTASRSDAEPVATLEEAIAFPDRPDRREDALKKQSIRALIEPYKEK